MSCSISIMLCSISIILTIEHDIILIYTTYSISIIPYN